MYDVKRKSHRFFYTEAIAGCSPIVSKYVQKDVVLSQKRVSCLGRFFCFLGFIPVNLTCLGTKDRLHQIGLWIQRAFSQLLTDAEGPSPPNPKQGSLGCVRKVTDCEPGSKPVRCIAPWLLLQAPPLSFCPVFLWLWTVTQTCKLNRAFPLHFQAAYPSMLSVPVEPTLSTVWEQMLLTLC